MYNIVKDLKSSVSSFRLKHDKESHHLSDFLCGMFGHLETSQGGVRKLGPLTLTYGKTIQAFLDGPYAGLQCTSMALAAIIHDAISPKFTPKRINKILLEGDRLHTFLRDSIRLSNHNDGKIAVEDIPHVYYLKIGKIFDRKTEIKLRQECQYVFTSKLEGFEDFLTIKEYLKKCCSFTGERMRFLISIRESSYAVILKKNGKVLLFDSHGHLKIKEEIIVEKAATLKFPSLDLLEEFLTGMYGHGEQAVIAPVSVCFKPKENFSVNVSRKSKQITRNYKPIFLTTKKVQPELVPNQTAAEDVFEGGQSSPFVGIMGTRC